VRAVSRHSWALWAGVLIILISITVWHRSIQMSFTDPDFATGYLLFTVIVFLAFYGIRKRLPMIPLGHASVWLTLHLVGGVLGLALFRMHVGVVWPLGAIDQALTGLFYAVYVSGIVGYGLQLWLPGRLSRVGREIIYERIPAEIAAIRADVEKSVLAAASESGNDTLGRYYLQTLAWYFARPRFFWSSALGGRRAGHWLRRHLDTINRYLAEAERPHLIRIADLGTNKRNADAQYAMQALLKRWPLFHVPLAVAMLSLAVWHLILVHVFAR
jgi:hypothetical protein